MNNNDDSALFHEEQKIRSLLILVPVALIAALALGFSLWAIVRQIGAGVSVGSKPVSDAALIIIALVQIVVWGAVFALLWFSRLVTEVRPEGIIVCFRPFHRKPRLIPLAVDDQVTVREYNPIREYGGWGIRRGRKKRAYTISGRQGLEIVQSDGRRIMIGTQRPDELAAAVDRIHSNRK